MTQYDTEFFIELKYNNKIINIHKLLHELREGLRMGELVVKLHYEDRLWGITVGFFSYDAEQLPEMAKKAEEIVGKNITSASFGNSFDSFEARTLKELDGMEETVEKRIERARGVAAFEENNLERIREYTKMAREALKGEMNDG